MLSKDFLYYKTIYCEDTKETCVGYIKYLESAHWKNIRAERITEDTCCHKCKKKGVLQLHHVNYSRLGHERKSDLVALCPECHKKLHEKKDKKKQRRKSKKQKVKYDKNGMPIKKEKSLNKEIKEVKRKVFDSSCNHCIVSGSMTYCELGYRYCPFKKCGDRK